jgi:hypothetical protein
MSDHKSGKFHSWTLDSETHVDLYGIEHYVEDLDQDYAENILTWLLDNAVRFHRIYLKKQIGIKPKKLDPIAYEAFYSESPERARHWMLRTNLAQALMRHLVI